MDTKENTVVEEPKANVEARARRHKARVERRRKLYAVEAAEVEGAASRRVEAKQAAAETRKQLFAAKRQAALERSDLRKAVLPTKIRALLGSKD